MVRILCASLLAALVSTAYGSEPLKLPAYAPSSGTLSEALQGRSTQRKLTGPALSLQEVGQLFWAAQGENRPGKRTVPSARAKYPLTVYLLSEGSASLAQGTYCYLPQTHALLKVSEGGPSKMLAPIKGMQPWIANSPAVFLLTGKPERLGASPTAEYFTYLEAGAASQSLLLQATSMGLGCGIAAGLDLNAIAKALSIEDEKALVVLPVGRRK